MKRAWAWTAAAVLLTCGCRQFPGVLPGPRPRPTPPPPLSYAVAVYTAQPTTEPSVVRFYEPAKCVSHDVAGTEEGFLVANGTLLVERVERDDGDSPLHVRVHLRNMTPLPIEGDYLLAFLSWPGARLISDRDKWESISIPPYGRQVVSNYCLIPGATRFILHMRPHWRPVGLVPVPVPTVPVAPW